MNAQKRKPFFIKGNFQLIFIIGFALLLSAEVIAASFFIYRLSANALEAAAFSSHIAIDVSAQIIKPLIIRVNIYIGLISILTATLFLAVTYLKLYALFSEIINGLKNLKNNNTSIRINLGGCKNTQELIKEFNHTAACLDRRLEDLRTTLNSLLQEKELNHIIKLHGKLHSIITGRLPG